MLEILLYVLPSQETISMKHAERAMAGFHGELSAVMSDRSCMGTNATIPWRLILSCFLYILLSFPGRMHAQDGDLSPREQIMRAYDSCTTEEEFSSWAKEHRSLLSHERIVVFADSGWIQNNEPLLHAALLLCSVYGADSTAAEVYLCAGNFFSGTSESLAEEYYFPALAIFTRLRNFHSIARIYYNRGLIADAHGNVAKADSCYRAAFAYCDTAKDDLRQGNVCLSWGYLSYRSSDIGKADSLYHLALRYLRKAGAYDRQGLAYEVLGDIASEARQFFLADSLYHEAISWYQRAGTLPEQGRVYRLLAGIAETHGNNAQADSLYFFSLGISRQAGDVFGEGAAYEGRGDIAKRIGSNMVADSMYHMALDCYHRNGDTLSEGDIYLMLGGVASGTGKYAAADFLYHEALALYQIAGSVLGEGSACMGLGRIALHTGDFIRADSLMHHALFCSAQEHDLLGQGNAYVGLGDISRFTGNIARADSLYHLAVPCYRNVGERGGLGDVYDALGKIASQTGQRDAADSLYRMALSQFQQVGSPVGQGNSYENLGVIAYLEGNMDSADSLYRLALHYFLIAEDPVGLGNVYVSLGEVASRMGDIQRADSLYRLALSMHRQIDNLLGQAKVYERLGDIDHTQGLNTKADSMYQAALALSQRATDQLGQGNALVMLAEIRRLSGRAAEADSFYRRALHCFQAIGEPLGQGNVYRGLADLAYLAKRYQDADSLYRLALSLFRLEQDPLGQGNCYRCLGDIARMDAQYLAADSLYHLALPFFQSAKEPLGQGHVFFDLGQNAAAEGLLFRADSLYNLAFPFFQQMKDPIGLGNFHLGKGILLQLSGELDLAAQSFTTAVEWFEQYGSYNAVEAHEHLARVYREQHATEQALSHYRASLELREAIRSQTLEREFRKSYQESFMDFYEEYARYLITLGQLDQSLTVADRMKARLFTETLVERGQKFSKGVDATLLIRRESLSAQISSLNGMAEQLIRQQGFTVSSDTLRAQQARLRRELGDVDALIRIQSGALYLEPVAVTELQQHVLRPGEVLLEFLVTEDSTYAYIVTRDTFHLVALPVTRDRLEAVITMDGQEMRHPSGPVGAEDHLHGLLFRPLAAYIPDSAHLIIVPDRSLALIPFEGLYDGTRYLLEKCDISYIQSASVLRYLRLQQHAPVQENTLLAFGDPVYDYAHFRDGKNEYGDKGQSSAGPLMMQLRERSYTYRLYHDAQGTLPKRLRLSGEEVMEIGRMFPGNPVVYVRENATEDNARMPGLNRFRYIIFSCHGSVNERFQALLLAQDIPGTKEDGVLTLEEIMNSEYNAELVVLSACETGLGEERRGEGVTGLTRGVMIAGARNAVTSLWSVEEAGTKDLMVRFYRNIITAKMPVRTALREAKLSLLHGSQHTTPFFWAAFVLYGE